jgi:uncharacterized membrane protein
VKSVQEARAYARLLYISENFLSIPAAIALALFGYATADRYGYDLDVTWLALGQILFYGIVLIAIIVLRPAANALYRLTQSTPDGPISLELSAQMKKPQAAIAGSITTVMFVAVVYLMVAKPGW